MENLIDLEIEGFPSSSKTRNGRYQVQYPEMLQKKGSENAWELSPGSLFYVKDCECAIRWDQQVLICTETSISLVGIRTAAIVYAVPSTTRLCSISELLRNIIQMLNNGDSCLTSCVGKIPLILLGLFHEKMEEDFRHWQCRLKPFSTAGSPSIHV